MTFERRKQGQENMAAGRINELCERENDCFSTLWLITSISLLFLFFFFFLLNKGTEDCGFQNHSISQQLQRLRVNIWGRIP